MKKFSISISKIMFLTIIFSTSISAQAGLFHKIKQMIDSVSTDNLTNHIQILENAGGHNSRVTFTPGNDSAVAYILREFEKVEGLTSIELDTFYISTAQSPYNTQPLVNIVATIEGKTHPEKIYIIGAHYDCSADKMPGWDTLWPTISAPGADDNATGVAALLEIARILTDTTFAFENSYTIKIIAFGAEEKNVPDNKNPSHYGSIDYANTAKLKNDDIYGVLNLDMLGYNKNYDFQLIVSNSNSKLLSDWLVDVNNIFDIDLILQQLVSSTWTYSDHKSFWDVGYKAVCEIEYTPWQNGTYYSINPYYHKSSDTLGNLNMNLVTKVTKLNLGAICSFSGPLTDIENEINITPTEFMLSQNYPNPFNPSTMIEYTIPSTILNFSSVRLKVFDVLGNEIATLVNENKSPGTYKVVFEGSSLSSGIYFYKLQVGNFVQARKMILIK